MNTIEDFEYRHTGTLRRLAPECTVLLKKSGRFPLERAGKLALYGNGARHTLKGGTGSGDVSTGIFVTAEQGLEEAGFEITTKSWLNAYDVIHAAAEEKFRAEQKEKYASMGVLGMIAAMGAIMPEPDYELPLESEGDTAVYVLSRVCGEGRDRQNIPGDFRLTETETRDILRLEKKYERFMLVLNTGTPVDLSPVADGVSDILLLSQLGSVTGTVLADLLLGKSYPSGKLTASWAEYDDYPSHDCFGDKDDTRYEEGVYVGYRYFETAGIKPLFSFGHGLSYTEFEIRYKNISVLGPQICVRASVKNTGTRPGRETAQLYISVPGEKLDAPVRELAAFAKTEELRPDGETEVCLCFDIRDFATFDTEERVYRHFEGDYLLSLGRNASETEAVSLLRLGRDVMVRKVGTDFSGADFEDRKPSRKAAEKPEKLPIYELVPEALIVAGQKVSVPSAEAMKIAAGLSEEEAALISVGAFEREGSNNVIGNAGIHVPGSAGETSSVLAGRNVPYISFADGPAGLRLDGKAFATALPVETALAQSFNPELWEKCGDIVGTEMEHRNIDVWLAPALNIQRNPLCGRNYEYFSEDPLLSGLAAAGIVRGVQAHAGKGVTLKHFAANNQETNRFRTNSAVSERALRDLYLRGFEAAIKYSEPFAVMSSYNLLNGEHTAESRRLLTELLRKEWGFGGIVISDWIIHIPGAGQGSKYGQTRSDRAVKAGNNLIMPGSEKDVNDILDALKDKATPGRLTREELNHSVAEIIDAIRKLKQI